MYAPVGIGDAAQTNGSVIFKVLDKADPKFDVKFTGKTKAPKAKGSSTTPHSQGINIEALRLAIEDLARDPEKRRQFGQRFAKWTPPYPCHRCDR